MYLRRGGDVHGLLLGCGSIEPRTKVPKAYLNIRIYTPCMFDNIVARSCVGGGDVGLVDFVRHVTSTIDGGDSWVCV